MSWIKLHRALINNDLWTEEPFTRGQAWVDLLLLANHKPGHIRKRGIRIELQRGQVGWSEVALAERWKWSRGKVRRFLAELEEKMEQQIVQQKTNATSLITITNYDKYQQDGTENGTASGTANGQQTVPEQEGIRSKEETYTSSSTPSCPHQKIVEAYHSILPELPQVQVWSDTQKKKLAARWKEDGQRQTVQWWESFFNRIRACDFLMGKVNGFRANLGWMVGPENFGKIMNGQYLNTRKTEETVY